VAKKKEPKKPNGKNSKKKRIVLDAMGGDRAPEEIVKGGVAAVQDGELEVVLVGPEDRLKEELDKCGYTGNRISIVDASEVIEMGDSPVWAIKNKRDSSIVVGIDLLRSKEASAFVSAGNTGAVVTAATLTLGKKKGVSRPALGAVFPFPAGPILCLDIGANAECKPEMLVQFAHMGSIYMERIFQIERPRIALLSIGEEESKGSPPVQKAHKLLKKAKINFIGNVEGRDLSKGVADVLVTDGFTGNVLLKTGEGLGEMLLNSLWEAVDGNPKLNEAVDVLGPVLNSVIGTLDYTGYGGAVLLGVDGVIVVAHGRSNAKAIENAVLKAKRVMEFGAVAAIKG
jgi:glycerol-3-phosphate acyltransferase PlsX